VNDRTSSLDARLVSRRTAGLRDAAARKGPRSQSPRSERPRSKRPRSEGASPPRKLVTQTPHGYPLQGKRPRGDLRRGLFRASQGPAMPSGRGEKGLSAFGTCRSARGVRHAGPGEEMKSARLPQLRLGSPGQLPWPAPLRPSSLPEPIADAFANVPQFPP